MRPELAAEIAVSIKLRSLRGALRYTTLHRMLTGKKVIVHGDGTSLWTLTHHRDFAKGFVGLLGDQAHSMVFDNTKIKRLVPDYLATVPFTQGAAEMVAWYESNPAAQVVDDQLDQLMDRMIAAYETVLPS